MKKIITILVFFLLQTVILFAVNEKDTLLKQKQCFYDAKIELENMLSGKIPLDYERAVFITENAYWNNQYDFERFKKIIDIHVYNIKKLALTNQNEKSLDFSSTFLVTEEQKRKSFYELLNNWAIFSYLTDTTIFNNSFLTYYHFPYKYSYNDPFGSLDWSNSQVLNLFLNKSANCYALTSLYKILSERLQSNANIGLAPSHVYIIHKDIKGIQYNIEIPTRSFPGTGSIMTLTYTTLDAVRNGIAMRTLDLKQSIALCLVYLGKGYEHKFDTKTDDFIKECAYTALKYDTMSLNAMLLNAGVLEERILKKNKTITQLQTDDEFNQYQKLLATLYENGYREMPLDMKNLIISYLQQDSASFILIDHTPKGFQTLNPKDDRYATLSWGMFDEIHEPQLIEQYGRGLLNTKTKKITKFVPIDSLYNKYPIDPVVFAWQIDPLASKYPNMSPYLAFGDNPIIFIDNNGREVKPMSKEALQIIIYGLSPEEAKYIRIDAMGNIDKGYLQQGAKELNNIGGNFSSLLTLANDKQVIEVYVQNFTETDRGKKEMGNPLLESILDMMYDLEGGTLSKEDYANNHPEYSSEKEWSGWFGASLYPDEDPTGQGKTNNGNIQIVINSNTANVAKSGMKKMTSTFAHEAYGHVLFKLFGLWHSHGSSMDPNNPNYNKNLENQINKRENEAEKNYDLQNQ